MRSGIWRFAVAPSDAAEKNRNRPIRQKNYNPSRITAQIYFLYDFGAHNFTEPFLDYLYDFGVCAM